jgi:RNA polymerase sigma-70 factor, ECF subfamily
MRSNISELATSVGTEEAFPAAEPMHASSASTLYRQYGPTVERWALRLGGPGFEAEDAVQEVFTIVHEKLPRFRGDSKLTTWLYGITENVVYHQRRRKQRLAGIRRLLSGSGADATGHLGRPHLPPLESIERREANARVYAALDRLREPYRSALILFELEELSGQEIAELKGVPLATVWVWLHRARAKFLAQLGDEDAGTASLHIRAEGGLA